MPQQETKKEGHGLAIGLTLGVIALLAIWGSWWKWWRKSDEKTLKDGKKTYIQGGSYYVEGIEIPKVEYDYLFARDAAGSGSCVTDLPPDNQIVQRVKSGAIYNIDLKAICQERALQAFQADINSHLADGTFDNPGVKEEIHNRWKNQRAVCDGLSSAARENQNSNRSVNPGDFCYYYGWAGEVNECGTCSPLVPRLPACSPAGETPNCIVGGSPYGTTKSNGYNDMSGVCKPCIKQQVYKKG